MHFCNKAKLRKWVNMKLFSETGYIGSLALDVKTYNDDYRLEVEQTQKSRTSNTRTLAYSNFELNEL